MEQTMTKSKGAPISLKDFVLENQQQDLGSPWQLENDKTLEINLTNQKVFTKRGAMIAYYGNIKFEHTKGTSDVGKMLKSFFTGEAAPLMSASGTGKLYVADVGKSICLVRLNNESISLNGNDMLAFEESLQWDIEMNKNISSISAMGLFSLKLSGSGVVAFTAHGKPLVLKVTPDKPLYTDPNATVCWSSSLKRNLKADIGFKTIIGKASGETYQVSFEGDGFVVVQPYEEIVQYTNS